MFLIFHFYNPLKEGVFSDLTLFDRQQKFIRRTF